MNLFELIQKLNSNADQLLKSRSGYSGYGPNTFGIRGSSGISGISGLPGPQGSSGYNGSSYETKNTRKPLRAICDGPLSENTILLVDPNDDNTFSQKFQLKINLSNLITTPSIVPLTLAYDTYHRLGLVHDVRQPGSEFQPISATDNSAKNNFIHDYATTHNPYNIYIPKDMEEPYGEEPYPYNIDSLIDQTNNHPTNNHYIKKDSSKNNNKKDSPLTTSTTKTNEPDSYGIPPKTTHPYKT